MTRQQVLQHSTPTRAVHRFGIKRRVPAGPLVADIDEIFDAPSDREAVVHLPGARVAIADYRALLHDFHAVLRADSFRVRYWGSYCAACRAAGTEVCHRAIDRWLVDNAAFVSAQQVIDNAVNTPILGEAPVARAYRPPSYGRALVLPVDGAQGSGGAAYFDIKGAGVAPGIVPSAARYSNGLEYLGIALADFFYAGVIDRIFACTVPSYEVVPVYAVLDLGFDIKSGPYGTAPAGLHVRRAHCRNRNGKPTCLWGSDVERISMQMELILRNFGLTSAGPWHALELLADAQGRECLAIAKEILPRGAEQDRARHDELVGIASKGPVELINIQIARGASWARQSAQLFDFGHFSVEHRFDRAFATMAMDRPFCTGRIIQPDHPAFVQPQGGLAFDRDLCSRTAVNAMGFYLAQAFRSGFRNRDDIEKACRFAMLRVFGKRVLRAS